MIFVADWERRELSAQDLLVHCPSEGDRIERHGLSPGPEADKTALIDCQERG